MTEIYKDQEKHQIIQEQFKAFVEKMCLEVGDSAACAVIVIQWQKDISSAVVIGNAPPAVQSNILDGVVKQFVASVRRMKERIGMSTGA